jgi:REP element-mobilizing transposase RayT
MNRGQKGESIFLEDRDKQTFLNIISEKQKIHNIKIFAYCIMNNHYHLVLENSKGNMQNFLRQVNGHYAILYRKNYGGRGYVFQDRYKSVLIENDSYLLQAISYVLANPLKAGPERRGLNYPWSSYKLYFRNTKDTIIDGHYIENLYENPKELKNQIFSMSNSTLKTNRTVLGQIIGDSDFLQSAKKKFNRRKITDPVKKKRHDDFGFDPIEKVIWEFERKFGIKCDEINLGTHTGKRLRGELLMMLKDYAGLTYSQISKFSIFSDLKFNSLGHIYKKPRPQ